MLKRLAFLLLPLLAVFLSAGFFPASGIRSDSGGTDTLSCADTVVLYTEATTVTLPDADTLPCVVGRQVQVCAQGAFALTVNRAGSDTVGGTTSVTLTGSSATVDTCWSLMPSSSSAWRALQLGGAAVANGVHAYLSGGAFYAEPIVGLGQSYTVAGAAVAFPSSADPSGFGATLSGANLTVNAATATAGNIGTVAQSWSIPLSSLGITIPSDVRIARMAVKVSSFTEGARTASSVSSVGVSLGTSATAPVRTILFQRPGSGTSWSIGRVGGNTTISTASGSATMVRAEMSTSMGDATTTEDMVYRFAAANDLENATGAPSAGSPGATLPTHLMIYVQVTGAITLDTWTLNDFEALVRW